METKRLLIHGALLLGLALRGYHYLRDPGVWHDEAAVIVNILEKDYGSLLGPLRLHQAAPPLFLWLEKAVSETLSDEAWALRLAPLLASCAALLLFASIARQVLSAEAAPWAVFMFACSDRLLVHACEVKPYAFDVLAATLLLWLFVRRDRANLVGQIILLAAVAPWLLWLSYPACFVYGGVLVALVPRVWRDRRPATVIAFAMLAASVGLAFLAVIVGPAHAQQQDAALVGFWKPCFPDWSRAWTVPLWVIGATLEVGRYATRPLGQAVMVLAAVGGVRLWQEGRRRLVVLMGLPLGLALLAALMHRYPYGGIRLMAFATPAILTASAVAIPPTLAWFERRRRFASALPALLLLMPLGLALVHVIQPHPVADTSGSAAFVAVRRLPDDPVVGNDWTHCYYFRGIAPAFHGPEEPPPRLENRVWVVWNAEMAAEDRFRGATAIAPQSWRAVERYDSQFTTAILFVAADQENGSTTK